MERDVTEGRRRCTELEQEIETVSKEIGEAKVNKRNLLRKTIFVEFCRFSVFQLDRSETSRAQRRAELIENLKQFPGVVKFSFSELFR